MAILRLESGKALTEPEQIGSVLAPLQVKLNHWSVGRSAAIQSLLAIPQLDEAQKATVLQSLNPYFETLQAEGGYQSCDLIVLHPDTPHLSDLLAKFSRPHTHDDDEVRYIIDGEGIFGFILPDGQQVELTVQAEDYINVPANTEHWFTLTSIQRVKAVRYFTDTAGWVPRYTDTILRPTVAV